MRLELSQRLKMACAWQRLGCYLCGGLTFCSCGLGRRALRAEWLPVGTAGKANIVDASVDRSQLTIMCSQLV